MLLGFRPQIRQIDVAIFIAGDHHHLHSRHLRGSRVGAVRRAWDQADIAMPFVAALVVWRIASRPAYSPCAPEFGCMQTAS